MLMAAGFAVALLSWPVALLVAGGFAAIYVPVIASEERFLRATFAGFDDYCRRVPRFIPRCTAARFPDETDSAAGSAGWFARRGRRLLLRALLEASRVQCCIRGRTAVPEPALPAAGAGSSPAPGRVSVFRFDEVQQ